MYTRGLGEQPGYYCYDANRPSWLPYWWDTWNESTCKAKSAVGNVVACVNPLGTQCSKDSWFNANNFSGQPNTSPDVSGPGIDPEENNAPPGLVDTVLGDLGDSISKKLTFNSDTLLTWLAVGAAVWAVFAMEGRR